METAERAKEAKYMEGYLELKEASKVIIYLTCLIFSKFSVVMCLISVTNIHVCLPEVQDKLQTVINYTKSLGRISLLKSVCNDQ